MPLPRKGKLFTFFQYFYFIFISNRKFDRNVAIDRLQSEGVTITTAESILFDLLRDTKHPNFKEISQLIKQQTVDPSVDW